MVGQLPGSGRLPGRRRRIVLIALTGLGNPVLSLLAARGMAPDLLVTREERGPFPHYRERNIAEQAAALGVPVTFEAAGEAAAREAGGELLIVASYSRILGANLLDRFDVGINLHPSMLPRHRGPNPFFWVIRLGEAETAVTLHRLTPGADDGPILSQAAIPLDGTETQGSLRRRCAEVAAASLGDLLAQGISSLAGLPGQAQDEAVASWEDKPRDADYRLTGRESRVEADRLLRAATPYPGAVWGERRLISALGREGRGESVVLELVDGRLEAMVRPRADGES